ARKLGEKRYFTGNPCPRGHVAERLVSNSTCMECQREKANERAALNREPSRERARQWAQKNRERNSEKARQWEKDNPERLKDRRTKYRASERERFRAYSTNYRARKRLAPGSHDSSDIKRLLLNQGGKCASC